MHVLLPTDVFPPRCGGAGWSAHALALALLARAHHVTAFVPQQNTQRLTHETVLGVPTVRYGYRVPSIPFVKNYARHECLWQHLADALVELAKKNQQITASRAHHLIIHAQHVQVTPPSVMAARRLGVPLIVTVRDHWPWDYFATGLHGDHTPLSVPTWAGLATDLVARLGSVRGLFALPAIPYIRAHVRRRQQYLGQADAVVAVSSYIARRLNGIVAPDRLHVIPNMVDIAAIDRTIATPPQSTTRDEPYLLYVGKLERNKGAHLLVDVFREFKQCSLAPFPLPPLVICGDGALRSELERELPTLGVRVRFLDWIDHDEVLRLMAHCSLLLFPSTWGEPLSRVLLEACACGAPILAMPTGGTGDVITDDRNGALEPTAQRFAHRLAMLLNDDAQRHRLSVAARQVAREQFSTARVVAQVERLYTTLINANPKCDALPIAQKLG